MDRDIGTFVCSRTRVRECRLVSSCSWSEPDAVSAGAGRPSVIARITFIQQHSFIYLTYQRRGSSIDLQLHIQVLNQAITFVGGVRGAARGQLVGRRDGLHGWGPHKTAKHATTRPDPPRSDAPLVPLRVGLGSRGAMMMPHRYLPIEKPTGFR